MYAWKLGKRFVSRIAWVIDSWSEFTGFTCAIGIFAASLIIVHEVITRYAKIPTVWQTELAIYLLMMATYVGAAYGLKHGAHIHIDIVVDRLPPKSRELIFLAVSIPGLAIAGTIAGYAWPMWWEAYEAGYHSESLWGPPLIFPYILLPLGMTFLAIQYLVYIARKTTLVRDLFKSQQERKPRHNSKGGQRWN